MCGIFGVVSNERSSLTPASLRRTADSLFILSESRGKEAAGVAILSGEVIRVSKHPLSASSMIRTREYDDLFRQSLSNGSCDRNGSLSGSVSLIGHSRLVTNGAQEIHENNQPVIKEGMVCIHNGIITNVNALWERFPELHREYEIDTEILPDLIRFFYGQGMGLVEAVRKTFALIEGVASVAILLEDVNCLLLATNNGSLYIASSEQDRLHVFASERFILTSLLRKKTLQGLLDPECTRHIEPGEGCLINLDDLSAQTFALDHECEEPDGIACGTIRRTIVDLGGGKTTQIAPDRTGPFVLSNSFVDEFPKNCELVDSLRRCSRCILPETMPFIEFDADGVCNYCHGYAKTGMRGVESLEQEVAPYRNQTGRPDCLVTLSGGRDSCYGLHLAKTVLKMHPVAYTYDWGMVTDLARRNQMRLCGKLGVEHILVSADINWKRSNVRKNVTAWLAKPDIGTVPIFMAGDKQYFYYANKIGKQTGCRLIVLCENKLEISKFKFGFCGVPPNFDEKNAHAIRLSGLFRLASYYGMRYLTNLRYVNSSMIDTVWAYLCFFAIPHNYLNLFEYIQWREEEVNSTLIDEYNWEIATDTRSTWRIGDGTAPFYNYIYYTMCGLTENDTLRSNQIREGMLTREDALALAREDNQPRYESIQWYCDTIGINFNEAIKTINAAAKLYVG